MNRGEQGQEQAQGLEAAYDLGYDCGLNGPNTTNCSFSIFYCKESTKAWERGKAAGELAKATGKADQ